ncbi:MAG TPA: HAMP domain-containing sensor histidine kinase [Candidatus Saccharimonadales bacterium]
MFRSATFTLTLWYLAIVMAICLVFSVVLYQVTTGELDRGLHRESDRISRQYPVFQGDPSLMPGRDFNSSAHRILWRLIGFNAVVLVGAGFASYALARRTLQPIEEAHEQQKRFTADVSHELRTPLTALKMESEVALMNPSSTKELLRGTLESNLEEAVKIEALINSLLRLTRLESEELQQQFTELQVAELAQAAIGQITPLAAAKNIRLDSSALSDAKVSGDQDSLVQLLIILLDNAIKYSPEGSAVTLSTKHEGDRLQISVTDKGSGIAKQDLEHVFDRFYRADSSRTKNGTEGYGLGLSIAKMITDVHGGTITLRSRHGHGTTAVVSLPSTLQKFR